MDASARIARTSSARSRGPKAATQRGLAIIPPPPTCTCLHSRQHPRPGPITLGLNDRFNRTSFLEIETPKREDKLGGRRGLIENTLRLGHGPLSDRWHSRTRLLCTLWSPLTIAMHASLGVGGCAGAMNVSINWRRMDPAFRVADWKTGCDRRGSKLHRMCGY